MLRSVIISPDVDLAERLGEVIFQSGRMDVAKAADHYLIGYELERFLRANAPQVVFLCIESLNRAMEVIQGIDTVMPATAS